jgi:hypothetical protein
MRLFKAVPLLIVLSVAAASVAFAESETLYKWTDRHGVQKFSNQPPPPEVETYEIIEGVRNPASPEGERSSYRSMMNRVEEEKLRNEALERRKANERAQEERRQAEADRENRISAERRSLEQEIEAIENRALGPRFTEGMRRAQIEELQKKIDQLEQSGE